MTATEWKRQKALRRFAEAVKAVRMPLCNKCDALFAAMCSVDVHAARALFKQYLVMDGPQRNQDRWYYRNLLRACGVDARHV